MIESAVDVGVNNDLRAFLIYGFAVVAVVGTMLGLSFVLGQRKNAHSKNLPFESGIVSVGSAQFHTTIHFPPRYSLHHFRSRSGFPIFVGPRSP